MTTQDEKRQRIRAARYLLIQGVSYSEATDALAAQFNVVLRQAQRYLQEAKDGFYKLPESIHEEAYLDFARTDQLYYQAIHNNQLDKAAHILELRGKLRKELMQYERMSNTQPGTLNISEAMAQALSGVKGSK